MYFTTHIHIPECIFGRIPCDIKYHIEPVAPRHLNTAALHTSAYHTLCREFCNRLIFRILQTVVLDNSCINVYISVSSETNVFPIELHSSNIKYSIAYHILYVNGNFQRL